MGELAAQVQAVVFDMDGVLVDTEPVHLSLARALVAPADLALADYEQFIGTHGFAEWLSLNYDLSREEIRRRSSELFFEHMATQRVDPMPGAVALIAAIKAHGLATAVVTMTQPDWTAATLRTSGLAALFEVVITVADVEHGKPAPDLYLHAARELGVEPRACLAIEDSVHGIDAAFAAGMHVVQLRQATFVPEPQPEAHAVLDSLEHFDLSWLDGAAPGA